MAQTSVNYGKITAVKPVTVDNPRAQVAGALVGGTIGLISGRNRSGSNQTIRTSLAAWPDNNRETCKLETGV